MHDYKRLLFWQKSRKLVSFVYKLTKEFPEEEKYGLTSQMRRASISIAANIAEGAGRNSQKDFIRFLNISLGSLYELETEFLLANDLGYLKNENLEESLKAISEISRMLHKFIINQKQKLGKK